MQQVYFDNAATTPIYEEVVEHMVQLMRSVYGNPSSTHALGRAAKSVVEMARKTIAGLLHASPSEIIFTSGGTEADNMILLSAVRDLGVQTIISSPLEHHAVLNTIEHLKSHYNITVDHVDHDHKGILDLAHLEELLKKPGKKLVSLMHVNNEIGNILDLQQVGELCHRHNALFHSDTVQSIGKYELNLNHLPVDFITASAHKFHGPKGVGFAYLRKGSGLKTSIFGGQQERGHRAGTESIHNIAGMAHALKMAYGRREENQVQIEQIKSYCIARLKELSPQVQFNGSCADEYASTYTLINVRLPLDPKQGSMLQFQLDLKGIACSRGSACQSGSQQNSHVLEALLDEEQLLQPSLRFSFSAYNTKAEVDHVIEVLREFLAKK